MDIIDHYDTTNKKFDNIEEVNLDRVKELSKQVEESKYNINKVEEKQKERDSVLHLLNLRLGGRPGQAR